MGLISYLILTAGAITGFLAGFTLLYRKTDSSVSFSLLMLAASVYSFGYAFELNSVKIEDVRFWLNFEYFGISWIPALWIIFVLQYSGKKSYLKGFYYILLLGFSATTLLLNLTNEFHQLYYTDISMDFSGPIPVAVLSKGFWYWAHIAYFNVAVIVCNYLFIRMYLNNTGSYRSQALIMLTASFIPWVSTTLNIFGLSPYGLDLNPLTLMITGVVFSVGILQFRMLELVPIALEYVFESIREGRILIDKEKWIVNFNKEAAKTIPSLNKEKAMRVFELPEFPDYIKQLINDEGEASAQWEVLGNDGKKYFQINISPITTNKNKHIGQIIILFDMTELKAAEQKLIEINATKDKFFSIIAHDLKNPFAAFKMSIEYVINNFEEFSKEDIFDLLEPLSEGSRNIYLLLENLLEWSRLQRGTIDYNPEKTSIHKYTEMNISLLKTGANNKCINLTNNVHPEAYCMADVNMTNTIIRNLVSNSIKFTGEGGEIVINSGISDDGKYRLVTISDTGIGMTKDTIDKLFRIDANFTNLGTANEKGTGLGLVLCKEFIELHGGRIWAESEPGKGSSFHFTLPLEMS